MREIAQLIGDLKVLLAGIGHPQQLKRLFSHCFCCGSRGFVVSLIVEFMHRLRTFCENITIIFPYSLLKAWSPGKLY